MTAIEIDAMTIATVAIAMNGVGTMIDVIGIVMIATETGQHASSDTAYPDAMTEFHAADLSHRK